MMLIFSNVLHMSVLNHTCSCKPLNSQVSNHCSWSCCAAMLVVRGTSHACHRAQQSLAKTAARPTVAICGQRLQRLRKVILQLRGAPAEHLCLML